MTEPVADSGRVRRRAVLLVTLAVVVVAAVVVAVAFGRDEAAVVSKGSGRRAPTFTVPDLQEPDTRIRLVNLRGRPVVLNFWASWCVPCRREMPAFQAVHQEQGDRVAFLGINHQDSRNKALDLARETGIRYPSGYDPGGKIARAYRLFGMPTTIFISEDGRIVGTRTGELSRPQLEEAIATLFRPR